MGTFKISFLGIFVFDIPSAVLFTFSDAKSSFTYRNSENDIAKNGFIAFL